MLNFIVIMNRPMLKHDWKHDSTRRQFRYSIGILISANPPYHTWDVNKRHLISRECLTCRPLSWNPTVFISNFNRSMILCNDFSLCSVCDCLKFYIVELYYLRLLIRTPKITSFLYSQMHYSTEVSIRFSYPHCQTPSHSQ